MTPNAAIADPGMMFNGCIHNNNIYHPNAAIAELETVDLSEDTQLSAKGVFTTQISTPFLGVEKEGFSSWG